MFELHIDSWDLFSFAPGFDVGWASVIGPCGFSSVGLFIASCSLVWESSLFILLPSMSTWASFELLQVKLLWPFPCPSFYRCGLSFLWGTRSGTCHEAHVFRLWQLVLSSSKVVVPIYIYASKPESLLVPEPPSAKGVGVALMSISLHYSITLSF